MIELVLDASVVVKWFTHGEPGEREAREVRRRYEAGDLLVVVPSLLFIELINVAGRRWKWDRTALQGLANSLDNLGFDVGEPELGRIADWVEQGLTAYDATYVALAEERHLGLVTDDSQILAVAPNVADPLVP